MIFCRENKKLAHVIHFMYDGSADRFISDAADGYACVTQALGVGVKQ